MRPRKNASIEGRSTQLEAGHVRQLVVALLVAKNTPITTRAPPPGPPVDPGALPDRLVFDLDPDEGLEWREVVDAAHHIRDELAEIGLTAFVRTTGGKGLHLVVPVERRASWMAFKDFARAFVEALAKGAPGRYTTSVAKSARRGKIFIDYIRNVRGATAVGSYSLRARRVHRRRRPSAGRNSRRSTIPATSTTERFRSAWRRSPWIPGARLTIRSDASPRKCRKK